MGVISLVNSGAVSSSDVTFSVIKSTVARVVGRSAKADDIGAGDAIRMAINKINEYNWEYLTVRGSDISIVAGTSTYSLPTPFKDHYSMRLVTNNQPLTFVRQSDYDNQRYRASSGIPLAYSVFGQGLTGLITLIPTPSVNDTLEYRYYRPMAMPSAETDRMDCPSWMERFIITHAQMTVGIWQGLDGNRIQILGNLAEDSLRGCLSADRNSAGEDPGFLAQVQYQTNNWDINHPQYWINGDD